MSSTKIKEPPAFSFKYFLWGIGIISLAILILINAAVLYNDYRGKSMVKVYSEETETLIRAKKNLFKILFDVIFDNCQNYIESEYNKARLDKDYPRSDVCPAAQDILSDIGAETLKDSSAIAYLTVKGKKCSTAGSVRKIQSHRKYSR